MGICSQCGEEHAVLDPTFRRPDAYVSLPEESREEHAKASDDLCSIWPPDDENRYFVRCVMPVAIHDREEDLYWGVWAELRRSDFEKVLERWQDPDQADEPPMAGALANGIPGYPETLGLPLTVQLTGPTTRAEVALCSESNHRFAVECREGVTAHRASEWLAKQGSA